jgi:hypothetical protein
VSFEDEFSDSGIRRSTGDAIALETAREMRAYEAARRPTSAILRHLPSQRRTTCSPGGGPHSCQEMYE